MTPASIIEAAPRSLTSKNGVTCRRIRFVESPSGGAEVVARFIDPKTAFAVSEPLDTSVLPAAAQWPEPLDQLDLLLSSSAPGSDASAIEWLNPPDHLDAPLPVSISIGRGRLTWRPGRGLMEGGALRSEMLGALAEFAFYEAELRRLEAAVLPFETSAFADACNAYRIESDAHSNWARFGELMESLALLRLTFARLEPRLLTPSRSLPLAGRRLFRQLCRRALIEDRLSAVTERLEACEDLYEGAVDRLREHRWYRRGNLLETIIVVLLVIEVIQLAGDMVMRWVQGVVH